MRVVYDRFKPVVKTQKNVTRDVRHAVLWYCGTFIATGDVPDILFGTENWYYQWSGSKEAPGTTHLLGAKSER